ncbi:Rrf2 family transcriptional regulator, group III [Lachnospiraceae bacterium KM106-2]|nr:Rrf2 family transcriptional regulator, group III [Lachnospiraceae bacterium KM106-2]
MNTKFSVALHVMTILKLYECKGYPTNSENIAHSVNTNAVVIRRIISSLKKAGLVEVQSGIGRTTLTKMPKDISLLDIYMAVKSESCDWVFNLHKNTNPECYIGAHICEAITPPLQDAQNALEDKLASYTLEDIIQAVIDME